MKYINNDFLNKSDNSSNLLKKNLRLRYKAIRNGLSIDYRAQKSREICSRFLMTDEYKSAKTFFLYIQTGSEVKTDEILSHALLSKKRVAVPLCDTLNHTMTPVEITSTNQLEIGSYGIMSPKKNLLKTGEISPVKEIDIVVVPALAYDINCNRLGMGGGYYDRFLSGFSGISAGLAYNESIADCICAEKYDIPVDMVITPSKIIRR